jgi:hypothetical protein
VIDDPSSIEFPSVEFLELFDDVSFED